MQSLANLKIIVHFLQYIVHYNVVMHKCTYLKWLIYVFIVF